MQFCNFVWRPRDGGRGPGPGAYRMLGAQGGRRGPGGPRGTPRDAKGQEEGLRLEIFLLCETIFFLFLGGGGAAAAPATAATFLGFQVTLPPPAG